MQARGELSVGHDLQQRAQLRQQRAAVALAQQQQQQQAVEAVRLCCILRECGIR
jgi:hypothetical protein